MQSLTRIFSMGLAVAFVIVVLAVSLTPAYGSGTDQEFKFGIRGGGPLKHRYYELQSRTQGETQINDFKFKVKNNTDCNNDGNGPSIWAKFFKWNNSTGSPGGLKKQKEIAPGKSHAFKFGISKNGGRAKYRYFELRADGVMIAKGVVRMKRKPTHTIWVEFNGYESDNFNVNKSKNSSEFVLNINCP